ncbi:MAG: PH domain-containing protein, partial [Actinobacteria bacterium]|nr:PH domain-containing protein [Actinomycetota bacterium]
TDVGGSAGPGSTVDPRRAGAPVPDDPYAPPDGSALPGSVPHAGTAARPGDAPPPRAAIPVYAITGRQLVVAALTGPQLGLVAVLVGSVLAQGQELLPRGLTDRVEDELSGATATTVVVLVLLGVLLAAAVSVAGTVLAFAEFAVERDDRRLRVRRGLITERTGTIPLDRIHGIRIVEGLLRRPLGYATVQVEVAGYRGDSDLTRTLVPLVHRSELPELLGRMLPELPWTDAALQRPPARARRRYWTVPVLLSLLPALALVLALPGAWRTVAVLAPLLGLALGDARWRGAGWALGPTTLTVRSQLVARTTLLVLARRIQRAQHRTQPLQRRADLASFAVALATGRTGGVRHLDDVVADDLQRAVVARTARAPSPAVRRDGSLSSVAPPE